MCRTFDRPMFGEDASAERAAAFAGASVIATLRMGDWQISQDVEAAMRSAVETLPGPCVRATVTIHDGWVDVVAADGHVVTERRCIARRDFVTPVDCDVDEGVVTEHLPQDAGV